MISHDAVEGDIAQIAPCFRALVAAGETYAYPEDLDDRAIADLWVERPPGRCVVVVSDQGIVVGSAKMGPNRPGRGSHIATASFMVAPAAQGQGIGRALGEEATRWARASRGSMACNSTRSWRPTPQPSRVLASVGIHEHDDDPGSIRASTAWPGRVACDVPATLNPV